MDAELRRYLRVTLGLLSLAVGLLVALAVETLGQYDALALLTGLTVGLFLFVGTTTYAADGDFTGVP